MLFIELLEIPLVGNTKESELPTPEEYTYWKDRKNRTFYVDYEIGIAANWKRFDLYY